MLRKTTTPVHAPQWAPPHVVTMIPAEEHVPNITTMRGVTITTEIRITTHLTTLTTAEARLNIIAQVRGITITTIIATAVVREAIATAASIVVAPEAILHILHRVQAVAARVVAEEAAGINNLQQIKKWH